MWSCCLGTKKTTEHGIDFVPGTIPIRQQTYRAELTSRQMLEKQITAELVTGVLEPAQIEWTTRVFLIPKKEG